VWHGRERLRDLRGECQRLHRRHVQLRQ
jgi:hypothetical protein